MLMNIIRLIPILIVLGLMVYGFIIYKETNKEDSEETPTETENTKEKEE